MPPRGRVVIMMREPKVPLVPLTRCEKASHTRPEASMAMAGTSTVRKVFEDPEGWSNIELVGKV